VQVVNTPEVMRVYIGSFWEGECMNPDLSPMFRAEQTDLLKDLHVRARATCYAAQQPPAPLSPRCCSHLAAHLAVAMPPCAPRRLQELPRNSAVRKINELVKRARMARVHALIIGHLKAQMPFFGQQSKQKQLLDNLADEFFAIMKKHRLPQVRRRGMGHYLPARCLHICTRPRQPALVAPRPFRSDHAPRRLRLRRLQGDFPNLQRFKEVASSYDFGKFKKLDDKYLQQADDALTQGTCQRAALPGPRQRHAPLAVGVRGSAAACVAWWATVTPCPALLPISRRPLVCGAPVQASLSCCGSWVRSRTPGPTTSGSCTARSWSRAPPTRWNG
jgi:hypothetical protein